MNIKLPQFATLIVSEWKIVTGDYHLDPLLMQSPHKLVQCMCLQLPPKDLELCYLQDFQNLKLTSIAVCSAVCRNQSFTSPSAAALHSFTPLFNEQRTGGRWKLNVSYAPLWNLGLPGFQLKKTFLLRVPIKFLSLKITAKISLFCHIQMYNYMTRAWNVYFSWVSTKLIRKLNQMEEAGKKVASTSLPVAKLLRGWGQTIKLLGKWPLWHPSTHPRALF